MLTDIENLYRTYGPMVLRRCRKLLKDETAAVDALQDTFVNLLNARHRLNDDSPAGLLHRTATNTCLNRLRRLRKQRECALPRWYEAIPVEPSPEHGATARETLTRLFSRHRELTKTVAVLRYVDGMTLEETASATHVSVSCVRYHLTKLRASAKEPDPLLVEEGQGW